MVKKTRSKVNVDLTEQGKLKRTRDGILFDSELEAKFYEKQIKLKLGSEIVRYEIKPKYILQNGLTLPGKTISTIYYEADFLIQYSDGREEIIDVKGMPTEAAKLKRKMFEFRYPDKVLKWLAYNKKRGGWLDYDELQKMIRKEKAEKKGA